ncbi:hypothetical protein B7463_g170, partial [Scytalidium lignicola]
MHELFLTTYIQPDDKVRALRILQGYCGMNPDLLIRRRLIWQGPRKRNLPGVNPKLLGNLGSPGNPGSQHKMPLWKNLHEQLVRQSYTIALLYDVQRDQFSQPVVSGTEIRSANDGPELVCDDMLGTLRWTDLPDPAGARPVNSRLIVSIEDEKSLCKILVGMEHKFVREIIEETYRFVLGNAVFCLTRHLRIPDELQEKEQDGSLRINSRLPAFETLTPFDPEDKWILTASIEVLNGNDPEQVQRGIDELMTMKSEFEGCYDFQLMDRHAFDTRVMVKTSSTRESSPKMDEGLFDVFDDKPQAPRLVKPKKDKKQKDKSKKRSLNGDIKDAVEVPEEPQETEDGDAQLQDEEPVATPEESEELAESEDGAATAERDAKRRRKEQEEEPVVTDTFETAQSREVAQSSGLQAVKQEGSLLLQHNIQHQVSLPPGYNYVPISEHKSPENPARVWPFELDPFQKVSIASIEREESVLVSAHTSAGKTVVAEYAIAQSLKNNQRVIYTSPIKALSNQKYREFAAEFGDVGLMTGDVTINPTATCLVMTTEILRSMLYRGSEIMREVQWVVFDEIHYMRDKSRGVVWEETIILLPDKVRYVFLSATIPNAMQFAEWITKIHHQPCHIVYTDFRPTPLQHYFFPAGADGIYLVVDENGNFREDNFQKAMVSIEEKKGADPGDINAKQKGHGKNKKTNKGGNKEGSDIYKIVRMIMLKHYNPVIVFSFSKRECEAYALQMSTMAFNDDSEKAMVSKVFESAIESLSDEDKQLPQVQHILPLLRRGIGVHHSGLLPILKETIEILFQENLIKVLFATETFSIGLNMPAKTVVFTSVEKFDGTSMRYLTPSEFIQMSGRAGRRGLDERGVVIMMINDKMESPQAKEIVRGQQDKLNSAFYLGYNMILNLIRVEGISPEFMLEHCFFQFQNAANLPSLEEDLSALQAERDDIKIQDEPTIKDYFDLRKQLADYTKDMKSVITHPNYCLQFIQPGRLVHIKHKDYDFGWGAVVKFTPRKTAKNQNPDDLPAQERYVVDVLLSVSEGSTVTTKTNEELPPGVQPPADGENGKMEVVPLLLTCIEEIGKLRIYLPKELHSVEQRNTVGKSISEVKRRFPDGVALLDPIEDMNITDDSFKKLLRKIEIIESRLLSNPLHNSPRLPDLYNQYAGKIEMGKKIKEKKKEITDSQAILQLDELKARKRVLRRLGFINDQEVVELKARVACEISSTGDGHELLLSELLFNRFFNELSPEMCAAVLSCFIFEEKSQCPPLREELKKPFSEIQAQARIIAKVSRESKMNINEDEYIQSFKYQLMEVVLTWASGKSFAEICKMTDVYEGSLIRLFRRLEELLRQMAQAAKVMGSDELATKFEESLTKIRRDIVAAQSLYL